jgi:hypothetical protein
MKTLITSCGRFDLLEKTFFSLKEKQKHELDIYINEDSESVSKNIYLTNNISFTNKIGQHSSIELFLKGYDGRDASIVLSKYYLHCEDDWHFNNTYDWIQASINIMEADPTIIKVLCNSDSPHPCQFDRSFFGGYVRNVNTNETCFNSPFYRYYGYLHPWENNGIAWHGFSWNPGVTRLDLLKQFVPFGKHEQDVAKAIYDAGYKVVRLQNGVCHHIGGGRSTHE